MKGTRFAIIAVALIAASACLAQTTPIATSTRGIANSIDITYKGKRLQARPDQTLASPTLVRLSEPKAAPEGASAYHIEFIGGVAGTFDLRDLIQHEDGTPAADLRPLPVTIISQLPDNAGTEVYGLPDPQFSVFSWYRRGLVVLAIAWLLVPAFIITRRVLRKAAIVPPPPAPPPITIADLLRPLVEAARNRTMTTTERARLELLLYQFWRDRLQIEATHPSEAISQLREHPQAGELITSVERWLHAPGSGEAATSADVARLLAPFEQATLHPAYTQTPHLTPAGAHA